MSYEFVAGLVATNLAGAVVAWCALNSRVAALETLCSTLQNKVTKHDHEIYGNNRIGLAERITRLEHGPRD